MAITIGFVTEYAADSCSGLHTLVDINTTFEHACDLFKEYYQWWVEELNKELDVDPIDFTTWCMQKGVQCRTIEFKTVTLVHWSDGTMSWQK